MARAVRCRHCGEPIEYWSYQHDPNGREEPIKDPFWVHSRTLLRQCVLESLAEPAVDRPSPSDYGVEL